MDDQLDNDLKNRIREVFDNYDDNSADEGWLELRKKFPEKESKRRAFAWMWWGAAALLLLFLSVGLWMYNDGVKPVKLVNKTLKRSQPLNLADNKRSNDTIDKISETNKHADSLANNKIALQSNAANKIGGDILVQSSGTNKLPGQTVQSLTAQKLPAQIEDSLSDKTSIVKNRSSLEPVIKEKPEQQAAVTTHPIIKPIDSVPVKKAPVKSIESMFAEDNNKKNQKTNEDKTKDDAKKVRFGVYAATYFNYAKGSTNQLNAGAGFTSDIKITKNLKLVTGITIGQNTLNYAAMPPASADQTFSSAAAFRAASPTTNALYSVASPSFKDYNASLVGLDIPVNLKYEFNPQKNETYFSVGLSSGTFINESYTYQYNYPSLFSSSQQTKGQTTSTSFDNFYFAKTLNVAFGLGYPLGKNHIVIEPFLKYPLDGLGSQQIKFGEGGLNLKFSFSKK